MPTKEKLHLLGLKKSTEPEPAASLDLPRAQALVQGHLHTLGLQHQGLSDSGHGGAHVGPTQLYYDWNLEESTLYCFALVYHFRHAPNEQVLNAYQDESNSQPLGTAKLVYEPDNQGMYLTKTFREDLPSSQFRKEMDHLLKAASKWSLEGSERVAERLQAVSPQAIVLTSHSSSISPLAGATASSSKIRSPVNEEIIDNKSPCKEAVISAEASPTGTSPTTSSKREGASNPFLAVSQGSVRATSAPASPSTSLHHSRPKRSGAQAPPSSRTPSPGVTSSASAELHHFFKDRLPKLFHHHHEEKDEEPPKRHSPQTRLDINEPRPTGMPLKLYSSSTSSRAAWER